jgi:hypothetical protein
MRCPDVIKSYQLDPGARLLEQPEQQRPCWSPKNIVAIIVPSLSENCNRVHFCRYPLSPSSTSGARLLEQPEQQRPCWSPKKIVAIVVPSSSENCNRVHFCRYPLSPSSTLEHVSSSSLSSTSSVPALGRDLGLQPPGHVLEHPQHRVLGLLPHAPLGAQGVRETRHLPGRQDRCKGRTSYSINTFGTSQIESRLSPEGVWNVTGCGILSSEGVWNVTGCVVD